METIFSGEYIRYVYDVDRGNIIVPANFRRELLQQPDTGLIIIDNHSFLAKMDKLVIPGYRYIHAWPLTVWKSVITREKIVEQILRNPLFIITFLSYKLRHLNIGPPQNLDNRGRIFLSPRLRSYAGIKDEAIVVGMNNRMEIWGPEYWGECLREIEAVYT